MRKQWRQALLFSTAILLAILVITRAIPTDGSLAIIAALIAGAVALTINETVDERRERDVSAMEESRRKEVQQREREIASRLREQRENAYNEVLSHLLASFTGGSGSDEFYIRSKIVMWGSDEFMRAYLKWRKSIEGLSGRGLVSVPTGRKAAIESALGEVALAAREDLGVEIGEPPESGFLTAVLFDNPEPAGRTD